MPHISESLDFLSQAKYLSVLECTQSYFHIPLNESDRPKTAFHTRRGLFQWCVLPQGATNAPAIFSRLISLTLRGLSYLCVLSFIDDLCVVSVTPQPRRYRPRPVPGTQLPGPQRRTIPTVVGRQAGGSVAIFRDGRFDGYRGAIGNTWFLEPPYMRCGYLHFTSFGAG